MALTILPGPVIQAGASLSDPLDCSAGIITRLHMPAIWTPANLTFQVSSDGTNFANLYSFDGIETMIPVVPGSAIVIAVGSSSASASSVSSRIEPPDLRGVSWLKVRSGPAAWPVVQTAQRQFMITLA